MRFQISSSPHKIVLFLLFISFSMSLGYTQEPSLEDQIDKALEIAEKNLFPQHPFVLDGTWRFFIPKSIAVMQKNSSEIDFNEDFVVWTFDFNTDGTVSIVTNQDTPVVQGRWEWAWSGHKFLIYFEDSEVVFIFMYFAFTPYETSQASETWQVFQSAWQLCIFENQLCELLSKQMMGDDSEDLQEQISDLGDQLYPHDTSTFVVFWLFLEGDVERRSTFGIFTNRDIY